MEKTIHDEMREKADLGFTYAEDGAFHSAARIFKEIAAEYEKRASETLHKHYPSGDYGKVNLTSAKPQYITVDGKLTNIERGSMEHARIDSTHRMRSDGSYFKPGC